MNSGKRAVIAVEVKSDLRVIVRAPLRTANKDIERFLTEKSGWIEKHLGMAKEQQAKQSSAFTDREIKALAETAREDISQRVVKHAELLGVTVSRITNYDKRKLPDVLEYYAAKGCRAETLKDVM
ncbi:MAG: DUF45 domain-containing protein [Bacillota bacterium]|nr:DUF45 domain-containing protein [Bacillota bacterium]